MRALALAVLAWLGASASGVAMDPFLPLAATLALHPDALLGRASAIALAPMAAAACALDPYATLACYGLVVGAATWWQDALADGPKARLFLVGLALVGATAMAGASAVVGTPMATLPTVATAAFAVLHVVATPPARA